MRVILQTFGYALLVLSVIGCDGVQKVTATTVTGRIEMEAGPAPPHVVLAALKGEDDSSLDRYLFLGTVPEPWQITTADENGEYKLDDVVPGTYLLAVRWNREGKERGEAIPTCWVEPQELTVFVHEMTDMENRVWISLGMYTSPFEVGTRKQIRIEISCD